MRQQTTRPHTTLPELPQYPTNPLGWSDTPWDEIPPLNIAEFRQEGSDHRPFTRVKIGHTPEGLRGLFQVEDRYIKCTRTEPQEDVYKDSCVEFFVQPKETGGYFNFEFNCGGTLLASHITDPTRTPSGFKAFTRFTRAQCDQVIVYHSMPKRVSPEIEEERLWLLEFFIPFALLEDFVGPVTRKHGQIWRGNFYKCADESSHPHWGAWAPVNALNFHLPKCFGEPTLSHD